MSNGGWTILAENEGQPTGAPAGSMNRIMIIGSGGAGKSTLARQVGETTGLPVVHLDVLYWQKGWTPTPDEEWKTLSADLVAQPRWIIDGNYGGTMELRFDAADTIVFVDTPRRIRLWRVVKRRVANRGRSRADMAPDCHEKLDWEFLKWVWNYDRSRKPGIMSRLERLSATRNVVIVRNDRDYQDFVELCRRSVAESPAQEEAGTLAQ